MPATRKARPSPLIRRDLVARLEKGLRGAHAFLQVVVGPRQVGKTTAVQQLAETWKGPQHYASADLPAPPDAAWLQAQWNIAQALPGRGRRLLVLDEVQKISRWSEVLKALFDRQAGAELRVVVLGSSSLLLHRGLSESLAGRFELHHATHWTFPEAHEAFGWDLERWLYYGGYPGAARLVRQPARWAEYIRNSLIESVLGRDVLQLAPVTKPALLRQLFDLACALPAQVLSFNKMLGQLQDAGNTTTLAHYLELLEQAFLVGGLQRFTPGKVRQRGSSPKLIAWNNALLSARSGLSFAELKGRPELWGRWVENAAGAHLVGHAAQHGYRVYYYRDGNDEVDFVLERGQQVVALEIKSSGAQELSGLAAFARRHPSARPLVIGPGGIPLLDFFSTSPEVWLK